MSGRDERTRNSDADRSPEERISDPLAGLDRLRNALKRIVRVPKEAIDKNEGEAGEPRPT